MIVTSEMANKHFLAWGCYTNTQDFMVLPHVKRIGDSITRLITGENPHNRLIIEMPPQHTKTSISSKAFASWWSGKHPDKRVALTSYSSDLAENFASSNREIMEAYGEQVFGVRVDPRHNRREDWGYVGYPDAGMIAVGVGGSLLGKRVDLWIVDDPHKNMKEALSPGIREDTWDWFTATGLTRMTTETPIIVIHQRWHPEDTIGRLKTMMDGGGPEWEILSLPAIAEQDEYWEDGTIYRKRGEALWPSGGNCKPLEWLENQKRMLGPYKWSCLYQQRPIQPEGTMWNPELFRSDVWIDEWPKGIQTMVICMDPAEGSELHQGDYPAIVAMGTRGDGKFYVEAVMERTSPGETAEAIAQLAMRLPVRPQAIFCEKQMLYEIYNQQLYLALNRAGARCSVFPMEHGGVAKSTRILRLDQFIASKDIRFVRSPGSAILVQQLKNYPHRQEHDDGPDALEQCFRAWFQMEKMRISG